MRESSGTRRPMVRASLRGNPSLPLPERALWTSAKINRPRGQNHESGNGIWRHLTCYKKMRESSGTWCPMIRASLRGNPSLPSPERALWKSAKINRPRGQNHESRNGIWRALTSCKKMRESSGTWCPMIRASLRGNPSLPSPERALWKIC
jgi:hypothetical protein